MDNILEVSGLCKKFVDFKLDNVSFSIPRGAVMGLIGENGAGKTTVIKLIMNMYGRDGGKIVGFGGLDSSADEVKFKELTGYVSDEDYFYYNAKMSAVAEAFSIAFKNWDERIFEKYTDLWNLPMDKKPKEMSKGTKTKMMLAFALAHKPELLILDEPTAGLDPAARIEVLDILRDFVSDGEHSVLFSTHITGDLDKIADYITMMINGRSTVSMRADEIEDKYAVVSGDLSEINGNEDILIGIRKGASSFEALIERKDLGRLKNVSVHTPNYENLLTFTIWQSRKDVAENDARA